MPVSKSSSSFRRGTPFFNDIPSIRSLAGMRVSMPYLFCMIGTYSSLRRKSRSSLSLRSAISFTKAAGTYCPSIVTRHGTLPLGVSTSCISKPSSFSHRLEVSLCHRLSLNPALVASICPPADGTKGRCCLDFTIAVVMVSVSAESFSSGIGRVAGTIAHCSS